MTSYGLEEVEVEVGEMEMEIEVEESMIVPTVHSRTG